MNIGILGGKGMVGGYLEKYPVFNCFGKTVCNVFAPNGIVLEDSDAVLNLAARTDLDSCERNPFDTLHLNTFGAIKCYEWCKQHDKYFIQAGTMMENEHPKCWYVKTKEFVWEYMFYNSYNKSKYLQLGFTYGGGKKIDNKLIGKIIKKAERNETIKLIENYEIPPLYAKDFALWFSNYRLEINKNVTASYYNMPIISVANNNCVKLKEFVEAILEICNLKANIEEVNWSYFRNKHGSALRSSFGNSARELTYELRDWRTALEEYLRTEWL